MDNWILDLRSIYIANGIGIFILLLLFYTSRTKIARNRTEDKIYTFMIFGVMMACFMEVASYTLDGKVFPGARILNYIANSYLYSVNLLLPFAVLVYVDLGLYGNIRRIWKHYKPQIFIGIAMYIATFINFFIPISYYITEDNVYERRPFSYVYYIVIFFYCFTAMFVTRRFEKENGARTFFNVKLFLFPILIGAGLQFAFYGLSLAWLSASLGLVGLYMMQQNDIAYLDALAGTYNRQYLNYILSAWITHERTFTGVMLDVDHFKYINDEFGHSEGDHALQTVADILKKSCGDHEWVFRFAGDEFIILKMSDSAGALAPYMEHVGSRLEEYNHGDHPYKLELSFGTSFFNQGSIDSFMKEMDENMYKMKEEHHCRRG